MTDLNLAEAKPLPGLLLTTDDLEVWMRSPSAIGQRYHCDGVATLDLTPEQTRVRDTIDEKVRTGEYPFEQVPCASCEGDSFTIVATKDRYGLFCPIVACKHCGLLQTNPRMTPSAYSSFYTKEFAGLYRGSVAPVDHHFQHRVRHGRRILKHLRDIGVFEKPPSETLVVDIGCSHGGVLRAFQEAGFQTMGMDLNDDYLSYGREKYGLDLRLGNLLSASLSRAPDLMLYCQVFEHVADPRAELAAVHSVITDETKLYVEVPGVHNLIPAYHMDFLRLLQNAHVYHYTARTFSNLFSSCGFRALAMNNQIQGVFEIAAASNGAELESDYDDVMRWLRRADRLERFYPTSIVRPIGRTALRAAATVRALKR
jgi:SAM-dependent methyltransferase